MQATEPSPSGVPLLTPSGTALLAPYVTTLLNCVAATCIGTCTLIGSRTVPQGGTFKNIALPQGHVQLHLSTTVVSTPFSSVALCRAA